MPVTEVSGSVVENLKRIRGKDKKINTAEEAKALLEYMPKANIRCDEDNIRLYEAYQEAQKILKHENNTGFGTTLANFYKKAKQTGKNIAATVSNRINNWRASASL